MPISPSGGSHPANDLAALRIEDEIRKFTGIREVKASVVGESKAIVRVPEDHIARLIGKKGSMISEIESRLGIGIEVEPMSPSSENLEMVPAVIEVKNRIIYVDVGVPGVLARIYVEGIPVLAAKTSNKGTLRIRMENEAGAAIFNAVKSGKSVLVSAERSPA